MEQGSSTKKFADSTIHLSRLFTWLDDKFLLQKLYSKLCFFILTYIEFSSSRREVGSVAQYKQFRERELVKSLNDLLELLEYFKYWKSTKTTPLLLAEKKLLELKLELLKNKIKLNNRPSEQELKFKKNDENQLLEFEKLNDNKEKIINFIKKSPNARAKDIIDEFSVLSKRTIKRNLKELTNKGFLQKKTANRAVYYSVPD